MVSLLIRNLIFTILQPGLVAGLIPYVLLRIEGKTLLPDDFGFLQFSGLALMFVGVSLMMTSIGQFAFEGKGTLSPLDPTKNLVVKGLYRYSRNPMYIGVSMLLIGEGLFAASLVLAGYAAVVFTGFNLFIVFHEEPRLQREFGSAWEEYRKRVRRWI